jgi:uncharacterized protein (DUF58 family)
VSDVATTFADKESKGAGSKSATRNPKSTIPYASPLTPIKKKPGLDFSITGLVYSAMMLFMGLAAVNSQANLLFGVFGLMVGILLVSGVISRVVLKRIKIKRVLPAHGVVGRPMGVTYEFTNSKRYWPSFSVCLSELDGAEAFTKQPQCYLLHVASGMTAIVPAEFIPRRRGLHQLDRYQVSTSFPFGFVKRAFSGAHKDAIVVYPPAAEVDPRVLAMCRSAENTGARMRPKPGGYDEFYGVSEFRQGDNPRLVHWRRSARTGVLVAKQMTQVSPPRVLLVVDTFVKERSVDEHVRVERAIAMAASLAARALDDGLAVGLYAWSNGWAGIHPDRGKRHRDDLLSVLARLPLNMEHDGPALLDHVTTFTKSGTSLIIFTPRDMRTGLSEHARGGMVVVSTATPAADGWFRFPPEIDWTIAMPIDQQPELEGHLSLVSGHSQEPSKSKRAVSDK